MIHRLPERASTRASTRQRQAPWRRALAAALLLAIPAGAAPAVGTLAETDLLAPVDVQISPLVSRETIATSDGRLLPAIARIDEAAAAHAVEVFDVSFARARDAFLAALEQDFGARSISESKIESRRFQSFCSEFLATHPDFPVGYVLAGAWARGDDGETTRARLAGVVHNILARHLIGAMPQAATVFVVRLPRDQVARSWDDVSSNVVRAVDGADVLTVANARAELWRHLGVGERFAGGFLETLVHENIRYDARLTALFLHERLGAALEGRFFGRGDVIVSRGQLIDAFAAGALQELEQLGFAPLTPLPVVEAPALGNSRAPVAVAVTMIPTPAPTIVLPSIPETSARPDPMVRWMLAVGVLGAITLGMGVWVALRLKRLRAVAGSALAVATPPPETSLRGLLVPHLAREMVDRGMQALFSQRQSLLQNEAAASVRVAEMETRVATLQPAIQERMRGYERRIKALERELQAK